jgi:uncharacterized membrane protein
MVSRRFRADLKRALPEWVGAGIITEDGARTLETRYRLSESGAGITVFAAYVLGALLVGGGIISLVAWNWALLSRPAKLIIIVGAMLASEIGGYWLSEVSGRARRLGHGLMLLGALVFGGNIGLVAQIFHVSSHWFWGVIGWGAGAIVLAWAVESTPIAILALAASTVGLIGYLDQTSAHAIGIFAPLPLLVLLMPFAHRKRSVPIFALTAIGAGAVWVAGIGAAAKEASTTLMAIPAAAALLIALALKKKDAFFSGAAQVIGLIAFVGVDYATSFHLGESALRPIWTQDGWVFWVGVAPVLALALVLFWSSVLGNEDRSVDATIFTAFLGAAGTAAMIAADAGSWPVAILSNVALGATAIVAIVRSVGHLERGRFWFGVLVAGALIVTRFFELETGLFWKGIAFVTCGLAVISIGVMFEARLKKEATRHAA